MRDSDRSRSPLELGALIALAALAIAGVLGVIAVIDADHVVSAFGLGLGVLLLVFLNGSTTACALGCLRRGRMGILAFGGIAAAGLATDMLVLAFWQEIDNEAYGKITAIALVWSFFALVALGLTLAVGATEAHARSLYLAAVAATLTAGVIATWLTATAGDVGVVTEGGGIESVPVALIGDDELLRALGISLVLLATLWFAALVASRLERRDATGA
jgi:hypothetical protein